MAGSDENDAFTIGITFKHHRVGWIGDGDKSRKKQPLEVFRGIDKEEEYYGLSRQESSVSLHSEAQGANWQESLKGHSPSCGPKDNRLVTDPSHCIGINTFADEITSNGSLAIAVFDFSSVKLTKNTDNNSDGEGEQDRS